MRGSARHANKQTKRLETLLGALQHSGVCKALRSLNPAFPNFFEPKTLFSLVPGPRPPQNMFCRTSANFGIAYPLPILGKVLLLVDPSDDRVWCTWAVFPSSAWVTNKWAVWPESWGRLGRAHRLCDLGSGRALTLGRGEPLVFSLSQLFYILLLGLVPGNV